MAFMMPVVKNDWDIYNSGKSRRISEAAGGGGGGGRVRKVSESRSEGPGTAPRASTLSPHRSAPAMRSLSYSRPPPSRSSLRVPLDNHSPKTPGSPPPRPPHDKFHNRTRADSPEPRCGLCVPYL